MLLTDRPDLNTRSGAALEPSTDDLIGKWVGRYRVASFVGSGGMGEVYRGYDPHLDRSVAIKRLRPVQLDSQRSRERLRREAKLHGRLSHPNIVQVYDFVSEADAEFIISEYVDGHSLREFTQSTRVDNARAIEILLAVTRGLRFAHDAQIIHRDLKPENVLVSRDGSVKITDFGISRSLVPARGDTLGTDADRLVGTLHSMSPEQSLGMEVDTRTDLFSLGIMAFEIVTGRSPFEGRTVEETLRNIRERTPPPLRELVPEVPVELSELVTRLLAKNREARPSGALEVERILTAASHAISGANGAPNSLVNRQVAILHVSAGGRQGALYTDAALMRFHERLKRAAARAGGEIVYACGNEALVTVGYPRSHDNNAEQAVRLVSELLGSEADLKLSLRAAVDVGRVSVATGETGERLFLGSAIDRARDIGRAAAPGTLVSSELAHHLLRRSYRLEARGFAPATAAAELGAPCYEVVEELEGGSSGQSSSEAAMFGRDRELGAILGAWTSVLESWAAHGEHRDPQRMGRVVVLEGEPGIGKSRLVRAFLAKCADTEGRLFVAHAAPTTQFTAFAPFRRLLSRLPGLGIGDAPPTREDVTRWIRPISTEDDEMAAVVAQLLGVASPSDSQMLDSLAARRGGEAVSRNVAWFLLRMAEEHPLILVFEDLHWADHSSHLVVKELVANASRLPIFVVLTLRPEAQLVWRGTESVTRIALQRLTTWDAEAVVARTLGSDASPQTVQAIVSRAEGVPLLLEELSRFQEAHRGSATSSLAQLPTSFEDSVQNRLQSLGEAPRSTAELSAVIGREVPWDLLQMVSGRTVEGLTADVDALSSRALIHEQGFRHRKVVFQHALVRDTIYEAIDRTRRLSLHRAIAEALGSGQVLSVEVTPELQAHHLEAAEDYPRAIDRWHEAGRRAAASRAHDVACSHFERALGLLVHLPEQEARTAERRLRESLGPSLIPARGLAAREIEMNNARLEELASPGAPRAWTDLYQQWAEAYVLCDTRRLTAALGLLEQCVRSEAPAIRELLPVIRYLLHCSRGITFVHMGLLRDARSELALAIELRRAIMPILLTFPEQTITTAPESYLAWVDLLTGRVESMSAALRAQEAAFPPDSAAHLCALAQHTVLAAFAGDFRGTRDRARRVVAGAPSVSFNDGHVLYVRFCDAFAELKVAAADPRADLSGALEQLDAQWAIFETWNKGGRFLATSIIHCAFAADAAVDVAGHPSLPEDKRPLALQRARRAIDWAMSRLADPGMEQMHRYFVSELHRVRARVAMTERDSIEAARALEDARRACLLLAEQGHEAPAFLMERLSGVVAEAIRAG
jgi:tRNA A-37 threonylcarbamoyl transferase component Bud32